MRSTSLLRSMRNRSQRHQNQRSSWSWFRSSSACFSSALTEQSSQLYAHPKLMPACIYRVDDNVLTCPAQAIPKITDEFNSLTDVGWYGSAYLLTCCALQLLFGRTYTFFSIKGTLLSSVLVFEAASALCGAAPNSIAFIIGRAVSGVGAAGIFAGTVSPQPCTIRYPQQLTASRLSALST